MKKVVELRPLKVNPEFFDELENRIKRFYLKHLYFPVLDQINLSVKLSNSQPDALKRALDRGTITYHRGKFSGYFDAEISKILRGLGARWDNRRKVYLITKSELPVEIRAAVSSSQVNFEAKLKKIDQILENKLPEITSVFVKSSDLFSSTLLKMDREIKGTLRDVAVLPVLTPSRRKRISEEWQNNLDIWIKDFSEKQIKDLRKRVMGSAFQGNRYESLVKEIINSYGVTQSKAKFLARQETSLLMTKYKETRYTESGITKYRWQCVAGSEKHPVRPSHKILEGKIFSWDAPPVTTAPGEPQRRNNPGCDYNCRCVAVPQVSF